MKFPRVRFSLRTLLLVSFLAGGAMLCWRVREPFVFTRYPDFLTKTKTIERFPFNKLSDAVQFRFSPSGKYIGCALNPRVEEMWHADAFNHFLDTATGARLGITDQFEEWHPYKDSALIFRGRRAGSLNGRAEDRGSHIVEVPSGRKLSDPNDERLTASFLWPKFSSNGKYLMAISRGDDCVFYDIDTWAPAFTIPLAEGTVGLEVTPDNHSALQVFFTTTEGKNLIGVREVSRETGKVLWRKTFEHPYHLNYKFGLKSDPRARRLTFSVFDLYEKWERHFAIDYSNPGAVECHDAEAPSYESLRDDVWTEDGRYRLHFDAQKKQVVWRDLNADRDICAMMAPGVEIGLPIGVSRDWRQVAVAVDGNALGIWRRVRENIEWWGIYERLEFWLAVALLLAFLWSVRRDWKDARKIALAPKPVSPSVSV